MDNPEPTYVRSNGEEVAISSLDYHHARAALAKLERTDPGRETEIANLRARVDLLAEEWKREHPEEAE